MFEERGSNKGECQMGADLKSFYGSKLEPDKRERIEQLANAIAIETTGHYWAANYFKELMADLVCISCGSSAGAECQCENES